MKRLVQRAHKALTWAACCSGLVFPLTGCDEGDDGEDDVEETAGDGDGDGGGSGDGDGDGDSSDATASEWMGSAPHLKMAGTVGGEDLSLDVAEAVAADLGTLYCERNYIVPDLEDESTWGDGYLQKIEFKFNFFYEDQLAEFQLEVEIEDLPAQEGKSFTLGSDAGVAVTLTVDPDGASEEQYEEEGATGTVVVGLVSGTPGDDGLLMADATGAFGAYVDVELSDGGSMKGSFTANCGENDLEVPEE
jgi:hypothetical protein